MLHTEPGVNVPHDYSKFVNFPREYALESPTAC